MNRREALAVLLGSLAGVRSSHLHAASVTLRDAAGRTVIIPRPPQRIVTIFSSNTELVASLGLLDRIVGIDAATYYPPEVAKIRKVGGRLGFSIEAIVEQLPDLILVTPARNAMHQLVSPMERIGIPIVVLMSRSMAEVVANVRLVGFACGEPARGEALAVSLEARLATVRQRVAGQTSPRVILISGRVGNGMLLVTQPNTYTGDAIILAGGRHALGDRIVPQVSPEAIWTADPDILLYGGPQTELDEIVKRQGWRAMSAVQNKQAYIVPRGEFFIPAARTVDGVERLATLFHSFRSAGS